MVEMKREPMDQQVKKYSKMSVEAFSRLPKEELAQLGEMPEILVELPETHQKALFAVLQRYQKNEKNKKETEATTEDMPQDVTANGLNIVVHGEGVHQGKSHVTSKIFFGPRAVAHDLFVCHLLIQDYYRYGISKRAVKIVKYAFVLKFLILLSRHLPVLLRPPQ